VGVGPRDDQRRHVAHVGGEPRGVERLDVLPGRDEDLPAEVAALLLRGELVLEVHAGRARLDHRLHQLEGVQRPAEPGLGVGHDRSEPLPAGGRRIHGPFRPGDLICAQQRVIDPPDHLRNRVGRVERLVRVGLPGQVPVGGDLPAGQVDGLQPRLHHLHRLVAGDRAERAHRILAVQ
jgi:hypothetical protein